jgi:hypothetical protein
MRVHLAAFAIFLAGCLEVPAQDEVVRFQDVHGLAVDPNDPRILYVATHHGLYRGVNGGVWSKVGTDTMDLMGFTVHPTDPNVMYASGHPARPTRAYHALGVIKSIDGGHNWTTIALRNQVDFHAMAVSLADPSRVWGYYYGDKRFYESRDNGTTWNHYGPMEPAPQINSIASHALNARTAYAGTNDGVWISTDIGVTWNKLPGAQPVGPAGAVATTKADPDVIWAFYPSSGLMATRDGGATWDRAESISFGDQDSPSVIAVDPTDPDIVYVASIRGAVYRSTEGGPWTQIRPGRRPSRGRPPRAAQRRRRPGRLA